MATKTIISEEDLSILMSQTSINRDKAKEILMKYNGDVVKSILSLEDNYCLEENKKEKEDEIEKEVDLSNNENLVDYRNIVDVNDDIYNKVSEKKELEKKKQKEIQEKMDKGESVDHLLEKKLSIEELYYLQNKGNFTSIRIL